MTDSNINGTKNTPPKYNTSADTIEIGIASSSSPNMNQEEIEETEESLADQCRTLRKIDMRVCLILGFIQYLSQMDRSNLGSASIAGMRKDLQLGINHRYNVAALVFFIPFMFFEFVSPIMVRRTGVRPFLAVMVMLWGVITVGTGFVQNWKQLAGLRVLLGVFESSSAPIVIHMLSAWYTRYEVQKRYAIYLIVSVCITSFNGILAYGFVQSDGLGGLAGWRWTYIWLGIMTMSVGSIIGPFIVDFPDQVRPSARFLNERQIQWVIRRLQADRGDAATEPFRFHKFLKGARSLPIWLFAAMFCSCTTIGYCVGFFLPILLRGLGFSVAQSLCLYTPPYLFPILTIYGSGWLGDRYRMRGPIIVGNAIFTTVGLILLRWAPSNGVKYFSFFMINGGVLANIPAVLAWQANNIRGQWVRASGSALIVFGGAAGGMFGAIMFSNADSTAIKRGIEACIGVNCVIIAIVPMLTLFFTHQNRLAQKGVKVIYGRPGFLYSI